MAELYNSIMTLPEIILKIATVPIITRIISGIRAGRIVQMESLLLSELQDIRRHSMIPGRNIPLSRMLIRWSAGIVSILMAA